jgi:hypothetical protein
MYVKIKCFEASSEGFFQNGDIIKIIIINLYLTRCKYNKILK